MERNEAAERSALLYERYKPLLFSLAYRMLGSVTDAEDLVQEAFLYWNEAKPERVRNEKAFLCKIVTNRSIDRLRSAARQRESYVGPWLPEPLLAGGEFGSGSGAAPDSPPEAYLRKETLSTAYLLLLQQLSWAERAVFILREAMQYDYEEIAEIVDKSSANCRQIYSRAKKAISGSSEEEAPAPPKTESLVAVVEQFVQAVLTGNRVQLLNVLQADAKLFSDGGGKVSAASRPILGAERVVAFIQGVTTKLHESYETRFAFVNGGEPGLVAFVGGEINNVMTFRIEGDRIADIYVQINPDKLTHLASADPDQLSASR